MVCHAFYEIKQMMCELFSGCLTVDNKNEIRGYLGFALCRRAGD